MSNNFSNKKENGLHAFEADYASRVFEESSVCTVSAILSSDSNRRKIFRSVVLLVFTIVFLYQCIAFVCYVLQHPTVVDAEILRPEEFLSPALTFCNINPIKRSKFCSKYPKNCTKPNKEFCNLNPRFCGTPNTQILKEDVLEFDDWEDIFHLSHEIVDLIDLRNDAEPDVIGPLSRLNPHEWGIAVCYSYYDRVVSSLDPRMKKRTPIGTGMFEMFRLDPEENELIYPDAEAGIMFEAHSPFEAVNPFDTGYLMKPGHHYRIAIKLTQEELHPYQCINYTEMWLKNNKTGFRSRKACEYKCIGDTVMDCHNCTDPAILYPYPKASYCSQIKEQPEMKEECERPEITIEKCINQCKDDCVLTKFSYEIKESFLNRYALSSEKNVSREIRMKIDFPDVDIHKITIKPRFKVLDIFGFIGGLLAFWIGLSMFQVVEAFDCMFRIAKHVIKKRKTGSESSVA